MELDKRHVHVLNLPTGAGKTLVAALCALHFLQRHLDGRVLWVAPRWSMLAQAYGTLSDSAGTQRILLGRIGGDGRPLTHLPIKGDVKVFFTTLSTWAARQRTGKLPATDGVPLLVLRDECHWAAGAKLGQKLVEVYFDKASMLDVSATPKLVDERFQIGFARAFADLCPEFLAIPEISFLNSGVTWDPSMRNGDVQPDSLLALGASRQRNDLVVRKIAEDFLKDSFRKAIVFTCSVKHASLIASMLGQLGIPARAVHSHNSQSVNDHAIEDFRLERVRVIVNVCILNEGFDDAHINAVYLARPTASLTLLKQMIGRGARRAPGKSSFAVVEFLDHLTSQGGKIRRAADFYKDVESEPARARSYRRRPKPLTRHESPAGAVEFEELRIPGLVGIPFAKHQSFGLEFELTSPHGVPRLDSEEFIIGARKLILCLQQTATCPVNPLPLNYRECNNTTSWRVTFDSSAGWEVVSPILVGRVGFAELHSVCQALTALVAQDPAFHVNYRCGLHLTLGLPKMSIAKRCSLLPLASRLERALFSLVSPSRLIKYRSSRLNSRCANDYCKPLTHEFVVGDLAEQRQFVRSPDRYCSLNLKHVTGRNRRVEIRMHGGTTRSSRIIPWIALWMCITNHARRGGGPRKLALRRIMAGGNRRISPAACDDEDLFELLEREGLGLGVPLRKSLWSRRSELQASWLSVLPNRVAAWDRAGWYSALAPGCGDVSITNAIITSRPA